MTSELMKYPKMSCFDKFFLFQTRLEMSWLCFIKQMWTNITLIVSKIKVVKGSQKGIIKHSNWYFVFIWSSFIEFLFKPTCFNHFQDIKGVEIGLTLIIVYFKFYFERAFSLNSLWNFLPVLVNQIYIIYTIFWDLKKNNNNCTFYLTL